MEEFKSNLQIQHEQMDKAVFEKWDQLIGGVDLSFDKEDSTIACSYLVVMQYPSMKVVYEDSEIIKLETVYIPGFLAFREVPHYEKLYKKLIQKQPKFKPQVILVDGNGILHQNQCGIASHLGVLLDTPTIGIAKTYFYSDGLNNSTVQDLYVNQTKNIGDYIKLVGQSGRIWGAALKSSLDSKEPLYISVGHKISLETSIALVTKCCKEYEPEPIRYADAQSRELIKQITPKQRKNAIQNKVNFLLDQQKKNMEVKQKKILQLSEEDFPSLN